MTIRPDPPVIMTPHGPVTESARLQAAVNLRDDPARREQVTLMIMVQYGLSWNDAEAECRRRYPEAFERD